MGRSLQFTQTPETEKQNADKACDEFTQEGGFYRNSVNNLYDRSTGIPPRTVAGKPPSKWVLVCDSTLTRIDRPDPTLPGKAHSTSATR